MANLQYGDGTITTNDPKTRKTKSGRPKGPTNRSLSRRPFTAFSFLGWWDSGRLLGDGSVGMFVIIPKEHAKDVLGFFPDMAGMAARFIASPVTREDWIETTGMPDPSPEEAT